LGDLTLAFIDPTSDPRYEGELDLRFRVLREPLGMGRDTVRFERDPECLHLVALDGERVVGCVLFDFESGRLRAMAVEEALQGDGVGRLLVAGLEEELRRRGLAAVHLHARAHVVGFYEKLGYTAYGEPFVEVGIPHRTMKKQL
jgi:predicted GNAT family N-acyltransferase